MHAGCELDFGLQNNNALVVWFSCGLYSVRWRLSIELVPLAQYVRVLMSKHAIVL